MRSIETKLTLTENQIQWLKDELTDIIVEHQGTIRNLRGWLGVAGEITEDQIAEHLDFINELKELRDLLED